MRPRDDAPGLLPGAAHADASRDDADASRDAAPAAVGRPWRRRVAGRQGPRVWAGERRCQRVAGCIVVVGAADAAETRVALARWGAGRRSGAGRPAVVARALDVLPKLEARRFAVVGREQRRQWRCRLRAALIAIQTVTVPGCDPSYHTPGVDDQQYFRLLRRRVTL